MEKKIWVMPEVQAVQFAANAYCVNCEELHGYKYNFSCDAVWADNPSMSSWIAFDNNGSQENGVSKFHYDPVHSWDAYNYMLNDPDYSYGTTDQIRFTSTFESEWDQLLYDNSFHACNETHTASSMSSFFGGWLIPQNEDGSMNIGGSKEITIYTGANNNNIHATFTLGVENIEVSKS